MDPRPLITAKQAGAMLGLSARAVYDIPRRKACRFESGPGHHHPSSPNPDASDSRALCAALVIC